MPVLERPERILKTEAIWRLVCENGRQYWDCDLNELKEQCSSFDESPEGKGLQDIIRDSFRFDKHVNPNSSDLVYRQNREIKKRKIPDRLNGSANFSDTHEKQVNLAAFNAITFYQSLQAEDGHWPGDYGGPLFLLPALIMVSKVTDTPFDTVTGLLMQRYMLNHQNEDGGWGLHIEGPSTMFGTVMQYCALRISGLPADNAAIEKARQWIQKHGGATGVPSWGKFFLSVLGVYDWKGCNSLLPEMWLLPKWLPIHPWRYWCHARMVYLPMAYCYGNRLTGEKDELINNLRSEIHTSEYGTIKWKSTRNRVCNEDRFYQTSLLLIFLLKGINLVERLIPTWLRKKAHRFIMDYVDAEDEQTSYIDIGPVNQIINSLCTWHAYGKDSNQFKRHVDRWKDYLWLAEDGMKMNGYNGSQLWDTAFATQALLEHQPDLINPQTIESAYAYLDYSQIKKEVRDREKFFRHQSVGGWPFSTLDHGWPISDCTAEGVKAVIACHQSPFFAGKTPQITDKRLEEAIDLILSFQNSDGGWATYENTRSGAFLELLNPSEVFGKIMIDYSWVECTSACITALNQFITLSDYRRSDIQASLSRGLKFIRKRQRSDGSWIGSWGVCFTYGTWFGVEALASYGESVATSQHLQKACDFLISYQRDDGGWGESHLSCVTSHYIEHERSQVVNTSWALLALMAAGCQQTEKIQKGIEFLMEIQSRDGDWPQQGISGVFNQNCMITYTAYRNVFPIWALGRYLKKYGNQLNYRPA